MCAVEKSGDGRNMTIQALIAMVMQTNNLEPHQLLEQYKFAEAIYWVYTSDSEDSS